MEPKLTEVSNTVNDGREDRDTSLHIEGFYRFRINDNIAITPGVIWLTAPNHDNRNDDVFIGVVRTVFYF
jgi:carbohydrate-selective porin OprB